MRTQRNLLLAVGLFLSACGSPDGPSTTGDDPDGSSPTGTLVVSTVTAGDDPDQDGYLLAVDGIDSLGLGPTGTAEVELPAGRHALSLLGVAEHCSVAPGTSLEVDVTPRGTTPVAFEIICRPTGARITVTTTGSDVDPDGYSLVVDDSGRGSIASNGTALILLEPGSRIIALTGLSSNCTIIGPGSRSVTIVDNEVAPIEFAVLCTTRPPHLPTSVLAFTGTDGDIHLGDASGRIFQALTSDDFDPVDTDAAWSPEGDRIAFTRGSLGIHLIDADGTDLVSLSPPDGHDAEPSWSPDGRRIAFVHGSNTVADQIYIMNADGTNRERLTNMGGGAFSPSWSPDGRKIAFSAVSKSGTEDLYVIGVDGTNVSALTHDWQFDRDPAWSPDGSRIAFVRGADYGLGDLDSSLYLVNPDGTNLQRFDNPWNPKEPAWTPDGQWITVTRKLVDRWELATIRVADGQYWGRPFPGTAPSWGTP